MNKFGWTPSIQCGADFALIVSRLGLYGHVPAHFNLVCPQINVISFPFWLNLCPRAETRGFAQSSDHLVIRQHLLG
jgi:hypothetical protein